MRLAGTVICALVLLLLPSASLAADPPNPNDPCSTAGRNTCGTLGVGFYQEYRYGLRWFGDFRGAVPGAKQTFCLDLGYWYPSPGYDFRESTRPLRNRENEPVTSDRQQKLAYAVWTFGRSNDRNQQAAVMLYVHSLMGDARPGELDPSALNPTVLALYGRVARDASRYHGPYRIEVAAPSRLSAGQLGTATVRVVTRGGTGVPGVRLTVSARGASGVTARLETNSLGLARARFTASAGTGVRLAVRAVGLASTLPKVYSPTKPAAARNGQRLVAPAPQTISAEVDVAVARARIDVSTLARPSRLLAGEPSYDRVTIAGAGLSWSGTVSVRVYGPFQSTDAIHCTGAPVWTGSFRATGSGVFTTPPATLDQVGWYAYQEMVPGDAEHLGLTTPCGAPGETFRVETQPSVRTVVSADRVERGGEIHDRIVVSGLAGQRAIVQVFLFGPYAARDVVTCAGNPVWSDTLAVQADGEYETKALTLNVAGYYTYREQIAARGFVRPAATACGEVTETTVALGRPRIATRVSVQQTRPGAEIRDRVAITGLGVLSAAVQLRLWGPFTTRGGITCTGAPYWSGSFVTSGDGTYLTVPVRLERAGYYTYQESIAAGESHSAFTARCGESVETTFARAAPAVTTVASGEVVFPGSRISDRIRVRGLGRTPAAIDVELFGPFASRSRLGCAGTPYWRGRVYAEGDGELRSPKVTVAKVGFYTWRETIGETHLVSEAKTECALVAETSLARPQILTGRGETAGPAAGSRAGALTPTRVRLEAVGVTAPILPAGIDIGRGALAVSPNIARTGWWSDGMAPGASSGAILVAGHVDSAAAGAGAFFRLKDAKVGNRVEIATSGGRTFAYRVTSVRTYPKAKLPVSVYSRRGVPRLVLVTCGGPFDEALGHYRDNIVVTAAPAR